MTDSQTIELTIAGWLASAFIGYRLGLRSQKLQREHAAKTGADERKRTFLSFMKQWQAEIRQKVPSPAGYYTQDHCIWAYQAKVAAFRGEVERVQNDFKNKEQLNVLVERMANLKREDWSCDGPCKVILDAMDNLIEFVAKQF